ncbi:hypothetical protein [Azonexus hydrophilus]|uniref:hypothetical protein n=1 Tax=Azonexus hydrophilus TaxID=418702 RepID=UPI0024900900|nr:hypothetical protein [Azonexus hydrophilus]
MIGLDLRINHAEYSDAFKVFGEHSRRMVENAVRRATRKAKASITVKIDKILREKGINIGQYVRRYRVRFYFRDEGMSIKTYIGLNPIAVHKLGGAVQTRSGVQVGNMKFPGTFIIRRYGGGVYRRAGLDRFPLVMEKAQVNVTPHELGSQLLGFARARFEAILQQEMNYEFQKGIGRLK